MIVIQGQTVQALPNQLTFKQRVIAFVKYRSTQVLGIFGLIYAFWQFLPDSFKADLFSDFPLLNQFKTLIYLVCFAVAFYQQRMSLQVVPVPPTVEPAQAAGVPLPAPLVLQPVPTPIEPVLVPTVAPVAPPGA